MTTMIETHETYPKSWTAEEVEWSLKLFGIDGGFKEMPPMLKLISVFRGDKILFRDLVFLGVGDSRIPWIRELAVFAERARMFNHGLRLKAKEVALGLWGWNYHPRPMPALE